MWVFRIKQRKSKSMFTIWGRVKPPCLQRSGWNWATFWPKKPKESLTFIYMVGTLAELSWELSHSIISVSCHSGAVLWMSNNQITCTSPLGNSSPPSINMVKRQCHLKERTTLWHLKVWTWTRPFNLINRTIKCHPKNRTTKFASLSSKIWPKTQAWRKLLLKDPCTCNRVILNISLSIEPITTIK